MAGECGRTCARIGTRNLDELSVADIASVHLPEETVYVAVVLNAHSRRVIGSALAQHLGARWPCKLLRMALLERRPAARA